MTDQMPNPSFPEPGPAPVVAAPPTLSPPAQPPPAPPASRPRRISDLLVVVLVPILAVAMFVAGVFVDRSGVLGEPGLTVAATASPAVSGPNAELDLITEAWRTIHDNYVDPKSLDDQALAYAAIGALADAVGDEGHTTFMTAAEAKATDQSLSGSFVGIGVQVSEDDAGSVIVNAVIPGTPAEEAGLRRGDQILAVDGTTTKGETVDQAVTRVRGPEGEPVTLTIGRSGAADFDVTITRRQFDLPLVSWAMVPGTDTAMIRLEQFSTGATPAIKDAISAAKEEGATSIILDLRFNPGGYVSEAVGVASQFVGDGIVYQAFERSGEEKSADVEPGGFATDLPIVVLTDGSTASSAEIVTGAIQDAKRGTVVGEKTFGTGTVLGRFDLADGSSLRIGTERWLTRGGRPIWHEGLVPDVTVVLPPEIQPLVPDALREMTVAELAASPDAQVLRAVELLKGS